MRLVQALGREEFESATSEIPGNGTGCSDQRPADAVPSQVLVDHEVVQDSVWDRPVEEARHQHEVRDADQRPPCAGHQHDPLILTEDVFPNVLFPRCHSRDPAG